MASRPPIDIAAVFDRASALHAQGQWKEAASQYRKILAVEPDHFDAGHMLWVLRAQEGKFPEAAQLLAHVLKIQPHHAEALSNYGNVLTSLGHFDAALLSHEAALSLDQNAPRIWFNRGLVLMDLGRFEDAAASYDSALSVAPGFAEALQSRAAAYCELGRFQDAVSSAEAALNLQPGLADAYYIRGIALWRLKWFDAALDSYNLALGILPGAPRILNSRGVLLSSMERYGAALESFDAALAQDPNYADAMVNRGIVLASLYRHDEALASFDRALALRPDYPDALNGKAGLLTVLERFDAALEIYEGVLRLELGNATALYNSALVLVHLGRFTQALERFDATLSAYPHHPYALSGAADMALTLCDWRRAGALADRLAAGISEGRAVIAPFTLLGYSEDAVLQRRCAEIQLKDAGATGRKDARLLPQPHDKLRIAYVSADFGNHPVSHQLVQLLERHDRNQFEITAISLGADDGSPMRARLRQAFDHFHEARRMPDREVVELMRRQGIDIAVDLNGHTQGGRPGIFAHRAAPVQVNYLGYPGTSGSACMDYILADAVTAPFADRGAYSEAIVHLPGSFFVHDSRQALPAPLSRREAGLPEKGLVFCGFNQSRKITAALFDVWMRLLNEVPGSVLWLRDPDGAARANLQQEAQARTVDPERLIFAPVTDTAQHMARLQLADIFLDTLPYNAHASAADALWAGVPLVTCRGGAFAGRVAASLVMALEMPELVTSSLAGYEELALKLARDPDALRALREKLALAKTGAPLFDTDRSRRHIEAAYRQMARLAARGEPPASFAVTPAGDIRRAETAQLVS